MTTVVAVASPLAVEACRRMDHVTSPDSPQRIVFIDVDGTILEHGTVIAPSTVTAIRAARRNGHLVSVHGPVGGPPVGPRDRLRRRDHERRRFAVRIGDGTEERLAAHLMPRSAVDRMIEYFERHGIHYFLQTDEGVYASGGVADIAEDFFRQRRERHAEDLRALGLDEDEPAPVIGYRPITEVDLDQVVKATFISTSSDTLDRAEEDLGDAFHDPGVDPMPGRTARSRCSASTRARRSAKCCRRSGGMPRTASASATAGTTSRCSRSSAPPSRWAVPTPSCRPTDLVTTGVLDDGVHGALVRLGLV
jgi:hypothetical protein